MAETEIHRRVDEIGFDALRTLRLPDSGVRPRYARLAKLMTATDCIALTLGVLLAYLLRFGGEESATVLLLVGLSPLVGLVSFTSFHLHAIQQLSPAEEFRRLVAAVAAPMTGIMILSFWARASLSLTWVASCWILSTTLVLAARKAWHRYLRRWRADGRLAYRTVLVGSNAEAARLVTIMRGSALGFDVIGRIQAGEETSESVVPELGALSDLREVLHSTAADCVFVASTSLQPRQVKVVITAARHENALVRFSANLVDTLSSRLEIQTMGAVTTLALRPAGLTGPQRVTRRTMNLMFSVLGIVLTAPLWVAISLAIKLGSPGHVFYRQQRVGRGGSFFWILKFRTMVMDADLKTGDDPLVNEADGPLFKVHDDPRVTSVGRWLRRLSLDELPQLINVIKGEMSLVGPRPPLPEEVLRYEDWQLDRLEVAPGITGLWQISGRSDVSFDEYMRMDLFYIENWSPAFDLYILAKTLPAVLRRRGSY